MERGRGEGKGRGWGEEWRMEKRAEASPGRWLTITKADFRGI